MKETISKVKQPSEWEKIIANETTDKELISKIHKQLMQLNTGKMSNPIKKVSKRTKQTFLQRRYQFSSVAQSCPTLCDPMDCSTPSFPVHHQLLELTQTHVHRVGDAIQPPHLLLSPSPPAFNLSQPQGLFQ